MMPAAARLAASLSSPLEMLLSLIESMHSKAPDVLVEQRMRFGTSGPTALPLILARADSNCCTSLSPSNRVGSLVSAMLQPLKRFPPSG